jgi:metallo-beta-lactamase family protein
MKLSFYGSAQEVTGSCFLLEEGNTKILIDCGLFQCPDFCDKRSVAPFPFNPKEISALFITHAHIDHTGRIPKLMKDGFSGKIYSSEPTKDLAELMLTDSIGVLSKEARRKREEPLYSTAEVEKAISLWEGKKYMEKVSVGNFAVTIYNAGHILGSAMYLVEFLDKNGEMKSMLFTGDMGNASNPLMEASVLNEKIDYLVMESTYGDREHEGIEERKIKLERVIERSVVRGGVLMIPAFSLERTQELIWVLADMLKSKQVPQIPVFIDSPLAIKATKIYQKYFGSYMKKAHRQEEKFSFLEAPFVKFTLSTDESKAINNVPPPKIIIAGSGMSTGGRILHHEKRYLSDPNSTMLFISYQAARSLGRKIRDGAKNVSIYGDYVNINCFIENIEGYSAHPDKLGLFEFIRVHSDGLKKVFTVHGEPKSSMALVQTIRDNLGIDALSPKYGDSFEL